MNRADRFRFPQPGADHRVILGLLVFQAQVLELGFDVVEAQAVGQRRVHEQRLRGDLLLLVGTHVLQGPHVVQAVGELDQNDAHVVAEGEQHLPEILRLGAGPRLEHTTHLGQPIDDDALLDPEHLLDVVQGHRRVLHRVVQQRAHDAGRAQPHFLCHHTGDGDGVVDVGFPLLRRMSLCASSATSKAFRMALRSERFLEFLAARNSPRYRRRISCFSASKSYSIPPKFGKPVLNFVP